MASRLLVTNLETWKPWQTLSKTNIIFGKQWNNKDRANFTQQLQGLGNTFRFQASPLDLAETKASQNFSCTGKFEKLDLIMNGNETPFQSILNFLQTKNTKFQLAQYSKHSKCKFREKAG